MHPTGAFPGKNYAVGRAPEQLIVGDHGVEGAAGANGCVPKLAAISGIDVGETNGPGLGGSALGAEEDTAGIGWETNESDLLSIGRPSGVGVTVDTRIEVEERFRGEIINADERVIGARGDESEAGAVGRPT